jgi:hypothetical protein
MLFESEQHGRLGRGQIIGAAVLAHTQLELAENGTHLGGEGSGEMGLRGGLAVAHWISVAYLQVNCKDRL